jgi:hypothetical protein
MGNTLYDAALNESAFEQVEEPEQVEESETVDEQLYGLLQNGYLTDTIQIGSNEVRIRTLKIGEELEAALVADKWKDTAEAGRALATALVAASIVNVDGAPLVTGLGPNNTIEAKFDFIRKNWYWLNVRVIYDRYDALVQEVLRRYEELKKD